MLCSSIYKTRSPIRSSFDRRWRGELFRDLSSILGTLGIFSCSLLFSAPFASLKKAAPATCLPCTTLFRFIFRLFLFQARRFHGCADWKLYAKRRKKDANGMAYWRHLPPTPTEKHSGAARRRSSRARTRAIPHGFAFTVLPPPPSAVPSKNTLLARSRLCFAPFHRTPPPSHASRTTTYCFMPFLRAKPAKCIGRPFVRVLGKKKKRAAVLEFNCSSKRYGTEQVGTQWRGGDCLI